MALKGVSNGQCMYIQNDQDIDRINIEGYQHALEFCQQEEHVGHEHQST